MRIAHLMGELDGLKIDEPQVVLRKANKIKTIQASLAIEGNTLSLEQVSDILDGITVLGPQKEILEVKNAIVAYEAFPHLKYSAQTDLKKAHKLMMGGLVDDAGQWRTRNVGVFAGSRVAHVAPQPKIVPKLIQDLFAFISQKDDISLLIKACVFHYELEFIHPFSDGNGRMGRFWQQLMLSAYHDVFRFVAIENLVKEQQQGYYCVLGKCDGEGESTLFIEFSLAVIEQALQTYRANLSYKPKTAHERLYFAAKQLASVFSRKDYSDVFKDISTATASRDLKLGVEHGILKRVGDKRLTTYQFKK